MYADKTMIEQILKAYSITYSRNVSVALHIFRAPNCLHDLLPLNVILLFLSDCGILQFTQSPSHKKIGNAHSLMHLKSTSDHCFTIVVASFYYFGRPFVKRFALCYRSVVCLYVCLSVLSVCLSCLSVCDVRALWPNGWTDQDETWHAGRSRPWPHCVRWKSSSPPPKGHSLHPIFGPYLLRPNGCMD